MSAVFILVATQFSIALSELRVSRMYERFSGLYEIGASLAEAITREINSDIIDMDMIHEYINTYDWENASEFRDGVFILSGDEFYQGYQLVAERYVNTPQDDAFRITHGSGVDINIVLTFVSIETSSISTGIPFTITVTNNSQRPAARNVTAVTLAGVISWNANPPIYNLEPLFNIDEDTVISEKSYHDFNISRESDFLPVELSQLYRR